MAHIPRKDRVCPDSHNKHFFIKKCEGCGKDFHLHRDHHYEKGYYCLNCACQCMTVPSFTHDCCSKYSKDNKMCLGFVCSECATCYHGRCKGSIKFGPI